jgi:hypothetical protein
MGFLFRRVRNAYVHAWEMQKNLRLSLTRNLTQLSHFRKACYLRFQTRIVLKSLSRCDMGSKKVFVRIGRTIRALSHSKEESMVEKQVRRKFH